MTQEQQLLQILSSLPLALAFFIAWQQERKERLETQSTAQQRIDALTLRTLELIRDIARSEAMREIKQSGALSELFRDLDTSKAVAQSRSE